MVRKLNYLSNKLEKCEVVVMQLKMEVLPTRSDNVMSFRGSLGVKKLWVVWTTCGTCVTIIKFVVCFIYIRFKKKYVLKLLMTRLALCRGFDPRKE